MNSPIKQQDILACHLHDINYTSAPHTKLHPTTHCALFHVPRFHIHPLPCVINNCQAAECNCHRPESPY